MTESPMELYQAGKLDEAVDAALALVKKNPSDTPSRYQLAQLSCFVGDLDRADRQLDTVSTQDPGTALTVALTRQLVRAELSRRECFAAGRVPEFIGEPSANLAGRLRALTALRDGNTADAAEIIAEPLEVTNTWSVNGGEATSELRDLDDLLAPILEVHTSTGKYFWIAWDQILSMHMHPPEKPLDLLWRQATVSIESGPDGDVYLPTIYLDLAGKLPEDSSLRLGRSTDWVDVGHSIVRGQGQKTLLVGEKDLPIMELQSIEREQ
jgi:type VI secretion system protein ImpE